MNPAYKSEAGRKAVAAAYADLLAHWPVPCESLRVPTRAGETFVIASGPAAAPPLVLLHGAQTNAASWMFEAAAWSADFRVFAVDVIGEPGLSAPVRLDLEGEAHALWLDDILAGLAVARAAFVGVSLGGWLALDYAIRRPGRVEALVLIAPAGIGPQVNVLAKFWPLLLLGPLGHRRLRDKVLGPPPAKLGADQQRLLDFLGLAMRHVRPRIVKIPIASDAALAALSMPILAVLGGRDVLIDTASIRRRLADLPTAQVLWLEDAGHFITGQAEAIHRFLKAVRT